ncbi:hypothetical protein EYQ97_14190 [Anaerostipes caccae L1-92]|uniref:Repeat protein n=2 Tax=Anaerostipes caccae TaxID=105841 RepID=B0MED0_ANACD|nr:repeat protein [Anaerostipes caccae L1-92]QMW73108.1 hypothetical protein EYQ97_14190 [Anaerostipes caccae L1-92]
MDVSHANVTITLVGNNLLSCGATAYGALVKDGMDDTRLIIQCEHADEKGHTCSEGTCGKLRAEGTVEHATAIGNITSNRTIGSEAGFSNLTIRGGIVEAQAGGHNCAIGAACGSYTHNSATDQNKYAKNIRIEGGVVTARGGKDCAGLGGGRATPVDGIYITGGTVYASGGAHSPGIGSGGISSDAGGADMNDPESMNASNIQITGGDTLVIAVGDKDTAMPGIGCGRKYDNKVKGTAVNITAEPDAGYQGYIQDGISETEYNFTAESPFQTKQDIKVDKYFTMVYFGPFRDENKINSETKEQLGANHLISKTGGKGFSEQQIKELVKANGKDKDGNPFDTNDFTLPNKDQMNVINEAKEKGEVGDYQLTIATENGTQVTVTVSLRGNGTDAAVPGSDTDSGMIGANDVEKETGGKGFEIQEIKELCGIKGKNKDGNNLKLEDFKIDEDQFHAINEAKTSKKTGKFPLTYETPEGEKVTVEVLLTGTVEISFDTGGGTKAPEMQSIDSGQTVVKPTDPAREGYVFEGWYYTDREGNEVLWDFEEPVYENITLKARWKEVPKTEIIEQNQITTETPADSEQPTTAKQPMPDWEYSKRKKTERAQEKTAKTGDKKGSLFFLILFGGSLAGAGILLNKKIR